jgi:hypothetical protein
MLITAQTQNSYGCLKNNISLNGFRQAQSYDLDQTVSDPLQCSTDGTFNYDEDTKLCTCKFGWTGTFCEFMITFKMPQTAGSFDFHFGFHDAIVPVTILASPNYPFALRWAWIENQEYSILDSFNPVVPQSSSSSSSNTINEAQYRLHSRFNHPFNDFDSVIHPEQRQISLRYPSLVDLPPGLTCLTLLAFEFSPYDLNLGPNSSNLRHYQPLTEITLLSPTIWNTLYPNSLITSCQLTVTIDEGIVKCGCNKFRLEFGSNCQYAILTPPTFNTPQRATDIVSFRIEVLKPAEAMTGIINPDGVKIGTVNIGPQGAYLIPTFTFQDYFGPGVQDIVQTFSPRFQTLSSVVGPVDLGNIWVRYDPIQSNNNNNCFVDGLKSITSGKCYCKEDFVGERCQYQIEMSTNSFLQLISTIDWSLPSQIQDPIYQLGDMILLRLIDMEQIYNGPSKPLPPTDIQVTYGDDNLPFSSVGHEFSSNRLYFYYSFVIPNPTARDYTNNFASSSYISISSTTTAPGFKNRIDISLLSSCSSSTYTSSVTPPFGAAVGCTPTSLICSPGYIGPNCGLSWNLQPSGSYPTVLPFFDLMSIPVSTNIADVQPLPYYVCTVNLSSGYLTTRSTMSFPDSSTVINLGPPPLSPSQQWQSKFRIVLVTYSNTNTGPISIAGVYQFATVEDDVRLVQTQPTPVYLDACHPTNTYRAHLSVLLDSSGPSLADTPHCDCFTNYFGSRCQTMVFINPSLGPPMLSLLTPLDYPKPLILTFSTSQSMSSGIQTTPLVDGITFLSTATTSTYARITFDDAFLAPVFPTSFTNQFVQIQTDNFLPQCLNGEYQPIARTCLCDSPFFGQKCDFYISTSQSLEQPLQAAKFWERGEDIYVFWGSTTPKPYYPEELNFYKVAFYSSDGYRLSDDFYFTPGLVDSFKWKIPSIFPFDSEIHLDGLLFLNTFDTRLIQNPLVNSISIPLAYSDCQMVQFRWKVTCSSNSGCNHQASSSASACPCRTGYYTSNPSSPCQSLFKWIGPGPNGVNPFTISASQMVIFERNPSDTNEVVATANGVNIAGVVDGIYVKFTLPLTPIIGDISYSNFDLKISTIVNAQPIVVFQNNIRVYRDPCYYLTSIYSNDSQYGQSILKPYKPYLPNTAKCEVTATISSNTVLFQAYTICKPGFYGPLCTIQITHGFSQTGPNQLYLGQLIPITLSPIASIGFVEGDSIELSAGTSNVIVDASTMTKTVLLPIPANLSGDVRVAFGTRIYVLFSYSLIYCDPATHFVALGCNVASATTCIPNTRCVCKVGFSGVDCSTSTSIQLSPVFSTSINNSLKALASRTGTPADVTLTVTGLPQAQAQIVWVQSDHLPVISPSSPITLPLASTTNPLLGNLGSILDSSNPNDITFYQTDTPLTPSCDWYSLNKIASSLSCANQASCNLKGELINMCQCKESHFSGDGHREIFYFGQYCQFTLSMPVGPFYVGQPVTVHLSTLTGYPQIPSSPVFSVGSHTSSYQTHSTDINELFYSLVIEDYGNILTKSKDFLKQTELSALEPHSFKIDFSGLPVMYSSKFALAEPCYWTELVNYGTICPTDTDNNGQFIAVTGCINPETGQIQCMCREGYNLEECRYRAKWFTPPINPDGELFKGQRGEAEVEWIGEKQDRAFLYSLPINNLETGSNISNGPMFREKWNYSFEGLDSAYSQYFQTSLEISPQYQISFPSGSTTRFSPPYVQSQQLSFDYSGVALRPDFTKPNRPTDLGIEEFWGLSCPLGATTTGCYCSNAPFVFGPDCSFYLKLSAIEPTISSSLAYLYTNQAFQYELFEIPTNVITIDQTKPKTWKFPTLFHFEYGNVRFEPGPTPNTIILPTFFPSYSLDNDLLLVVDDVDENGRKPFPSRYSFGPLAYYSQPNVVGTALYNPVQALGSEWKYFTQNLSCTNGFCGLVCSSRCDIANRVLILTKSQSGISIPFHHVDFLQYSKFYLYAERVTDDIPTMQLLTVDSTRTRFVLPTPLLDFHPDAKAAKFNLLMVDYNSNNVLLQTTPYAPMITFEIGCSVSSCSPSVSLLHPAAPQGTQPLLLSFQQPIVNPQNAAVVGTISSGARGQVTIPAYIDITPGQIFKISIKTYPQIGPNTFSPNPTLISTITHIIADPLPTVDTIISTTLPSNLVSTKVFYEVSTTPSLVFSTSPFTILPKCFGTCGPNGTCSATTQKCSCSSGFTGATCSEAVPVVVTDCPSCNKAHTASCNDKKECVCQTGFGGKFCDVPKVCETQSDSFCNAPYGFLKPNAAETDCSSECTCKSFWVGTNCQSCSLQCYNGGARYKNCDQCGCTAGFTGTNCQCKSVKGKITMNGYNNGLIELFSLLRELSLTVDSTLPQYLDDLSSLYDLIRVESGNAMSELMSIDETSVVMKLSNSPNDENKTTFDLTITYGCDSMNPDVTADQLKNKWEYMAINLMSHPLILKHFTFPEGAAAPEANLEPTDNTLPGSDDTFVEENVSFRAQYSLFYFVVFILSFVVFNY